MAELEKMTIKVPADARDLLLDVADLLRENPAFRDRLRNVVDEERRPSIAVMFREVLQRLDGFERRLDGIDAELQESGGKEFAGPDPDWTTGVGAGRKLTVSGEEELNRLFERGLSDKQIARRLGLGNSSVAARRKRFDLEQSARSGSS